MPFGDARRRPAFGEGMTPSLAVLKFGGSVLRDVGSVPVVVREVRRGLESHGRVIAVVSAMLSQTDTLDRAAHARCAHPSPDTLAFYLGLGELMAVGEVTLGLQSAGIPATARMPWDVHLLTTGEPMHANPVAVARYAFESAFAEHPVVVFPGFVGHGHDGTAHVLGRGGSDLTAIFLAAELAADRCVLFKSPPGVYEWDPKRAGQAPRRYERISWDDAASLGGRVLHPEHVAYARSRSLSIEITGPGDTFPPTVLGPGPSQLAPAAVRSKRGSRE